MQLIRSKLFLTKRWLVPWWVVWLSSRGFASDATNITELVTAVNTLWVVLAAILVFFMQAGFAMLEAGFIRAKNTCNVLMKNVLDFSMAQFGFFVLGYGIMFGAGNLFFGYEGFLLKNIDPMINGIPLYVFWFFQACFAGAAATIVSGAVAERLKFKAYLVYSLLLSLVVYPVIGHWIWGGGWLAELGMLDFAGSTVVHATGGFAALVGAAMLGPRLGKWNNDGVERALMGHNIPMATLGMMILWLGWFGFNAGSTISGMDYNSIALILFNTNIAAAGGAVAALLTVWWKFGKPDMSMVINGVLAGLVGITAPCAFVTPEAAIVIGLLSGILVVFGIEWIDKILKVDDPVGAIAVHGLNGVWGTIAVGLFHSSQGLFYGGGFKLVGVQLLGSVATTAFVLVTMFIIFKGIQLTIGLRVSREEEIKGLDIEEHGMEAYAGFQIFNQQ